MLETASQTINVTQMSLPGTNPSDHPRFVPASAIENLSLSHRDGPLHQRHSIGDFRCPEKSLIQVRDSGNKPGLDKEEVMKALIDIKERIASKFKGLPNEKEVLDLCDDFRVGLCAIMGDNIDQNSEFIRRFGSATTGITDPSAVQPLSLIDTQRKLKVPEDAEEMHKLHMNELSNMTAESLLLGVRAMFDCYMEVAPSSTEDYLGLYAALLRKLFPEAYGYIVTEGYCDVWDLWLPYAQVVKRTRDAPEGKVLLVVMGQRQCWDDDYKAVVDFRLICHLGRLGDLTFKRQGTYHQDRVFWLGFRGAEFGCGWRFAGHDPVRFWPAEGKIFQDVRNEADANKLRDFAVTIASSVPLGYASHP